MNKWVFYLQTSITNNVQRAANFNPKQAGGGRSLPL